MLKGLHRAIAVACLLTWSSSHAADAVPPHWVAFHAARVAPNQGLYLPDAPQAPTAATTRAVLRLADAMDTQDGAHLGILHDAGSTFSIYPIVLRPDEAGPDLLEPVPPALITRFSTDLTEKLEDARLKYARRPHIRFRPGEPVFDREILGAAWVAIRGESEFLTQADAAFHRLQDAASVEHTSASGRRYSARATGNLREVSLEFGTVDANGRDRIESRVGTQSFSVQASRKWVSQDALIAIEYDVDEDYSNHKVQLRLEKPWW